VAKTINGSDNFLKRQSKATVTRANPAGNPSVLDKVAIQVAHERHGATETPPAQRQHVAHELP
jgi:hypothetical protein